MEELDKKLDLLVPIIKNLNLDISSLATMIINLV